ncbi:Glutathione S-transferase S1 [Linnemannia hyalina]|uniref:glutathione transferase n=1 Tax=Linnemannia hyalina TaxID=64524 RepID=A0A9P8BS01_9FUNG|nr:Glutathione S-transferase S1 [Linnemannia hyalina]
MSKVARRPFITDVSIEKSIQILADPNVSYKLMYWNAFSVGATSRELLAFGNVKWSNERIATSSEKQDKEDPWEEGKIPTPFGVVPMLKIVSPANEEVIVAESMVIEQYLAKKFNLLGNNEWESLTINAFYSNIHFFLERALSKVTWVVPERRKSELEIFLQHILPEFIADHDMHLKANGSNGFYVGDRLSLADIHLANVIDHFSHLPVAHLIIPLFEKSELISKVRANVENHPSIAAWRASEEWESLCQGSIVCYKKTALLAEDLEAFAIKDE